MRRREFFSEKIIIVVSDNIVGLREDEKMKKRRNI